MLACMNSSQSTTKDQIHVHVLICGFYNYVRGTFITRSRWAITALGVRRVGRVPWHNFDYQPRKSHVLRRAVACGVSPERAARSRTTGLLHGYRGIHRSERRLRLRHPISRMLSEHALLVRSVDSSGSRHGDHLWNNHHRGSTLDMQSDWRFVYRPMRIRLSKRRHLQELRSMIPGKLQGNTMRSCSQSAWKIAVCISMLVAPLAMVGGSTATAEETSLLPKRLLIAYAEGLMRIPSLAVTYKNTFGQTCAIEWSQASGNYCIESSCGGMDTWAILEVDKNLGYISAINKFFFVSSSGSDRKQEVYPGKLKRTIPLPFEHQGPRRVPMTDPLAILCYQEISAAKHAWEHHLHPSDFLNKDWISIRVNQLVEMPSQFEDHAVALTIPPHLSVNDGSGRLVDGIPKAWEVIFGVSSMDNGIVLPIRAYRCVWWDEIEPNANYGVRHLQDAVIKLEYSYRLVPVEGATPVPIIADIACSYMRNGRVELEPAAPQWTCTDVQHDVTRDYASERAIRAKSIIDEKTGSCIDQE